MRESDLKVLQPTEANTSCNNSIGMASRVPASLVHAQLQELLPPGKMKAIVCVVYISF